MHLPRHTGGVSAAAAALVVALVGVAACGTEPPQAGGAPSTEPSTEPSPEVTGSPEATGAPEEGADEEGEATAVTVTLADGQIELSQVAFTAGDHTFVIEHDGQEPHAFAITGPGVSEEIPEIEPGGDPEELSVTLEAGSYRLWCPVSGHAEDGMDLTIEVEES
jgi:plastocyanin